MKVTILKLLCFAVPFVFINKESSAQSEIDLIQAGSLAKKAGNIDSAYYYYYLDFKNKVDNYNLKESKWVYPMIYEWSALARQEEGEVEDNDDSYVAPYNSNHFIQIAYYQLQKNKYHSAINYFLNIINTGDPIQLPWLGYYNAAVLLSNLKPSGFVKEANDLFEFARRSAPNDAAAIQLFAKAEAFLKANKPIPISMIENKIFDNYVLANKFETVDEYNRRYHKGKYVENKPAPSTNELGISESDFNQYSRLISEADKAFKSAISRVDSYNRKTKDGTINTQTAESILSEGFIASDVRESTSSLEKANNILRRAKTSENSNKINAAINNNEEKIKTLNSFLDKKKN